MTANLLRFAHELEYQNSSRYIKYNVREKTPYKDFLMQNQRPHSGEIINVVLFFAGFYLQSELEKHSLTFVVIIMLSLGS